MERAVLVCFSLLFSVTSCRRSATAPFSDSFPRTSRATEEIDACALITKEEVGTVQGTTISNATAGKSASGNYLMTQCYYASTGPNLSVSLAVTQPDPKNSAAPTARERWEQTFSRLDKEQTKIKEEEEKKKKEEGAKAAAREEQEEVSQPKKIEGVGEKAFWSGNRFGGALYVLKGEVFIRVSVGGPDREETKIEKSKNLAQKALERLP